MHGQAKVGEASAPRSLAHHAFATKIPAIPSNSMSDQTDKCSPVQLELQVGAHRAHLLARLQCTSGRQQPQLLACKRKAGGKKAAGGAHGAHLLARLQRTNGSTSGVAKQRLTRTGVKEQGGGGGRTPCPSHAQQAVQQPIPVRLRTVLPCRAQQAPDNGSKAAVLQDPTSRCDITVSLPYLNVLKLTPSNKQRSNSVNKCRMTALTFICSSYSRSCMAAVAALHSRGAGGSSSKCLTGAAGQAGGARQS